MGYETHRNLSTPARTPRLLLADDTSQASSAYAALLRDAGYEVIWARHSAEALGQLRGQAFALVLYNLGDEGDDAADFLQAMTQLQPRVPAIVISQAPARHTNAPLPRAGAGAG